MKGRPAIAAGPVYSSHCQLPENVADGEDMPPSAPRRGARVRRRSAAGDTRPGCDSARGCRFFLISAQEAQPPLSLQAAQKRPAAIDGGHDVGVTGVDEGPSLLLA